MNEDAKRLFPFAEEAVTALGFIKPQHVDLIATLLTLCEVHHPREIFTKFRKRGEQLSRDEKKAIGLRANAFMSREAYDQLTAVGHKEPLDAHYVTLLRATFSMFRDRTLRSDVVHHPGANLSYCAIDRQCSTCRRLDGQPLKKELAASLPPPDCPVPACNITFSWHVDWFADLN